MHHSKFDPQKHHRKSIRLQGYDYSQAGAYYVTIITYQRDCLFGKIENEEMVLNDFGMIADECWRAIPDHFPFVELGAYVIMPNHAHGVIVIRNVDDGRRGAAMLRPYDRALTMATKIPIKSMSNLVHWAQLSVRTNLPYPTASTRSTTRQESGSAIIMKELSVTRTRRIVSICTSKPTPPNGMGTTRTHQIIGDKIHPNG